MAPCNGTTSTPPKLAVTLPNHSTLQHPTIAPSNGTTSSAPCNGTLVPRQSGSSPSPLLEVRTPIAIAIWGIKRLYPWQLVYRKSHEPPKLKPLTAMTSPYSWTGRLWASHASQIHLIRSCDQSKDHLAGDLPNRRKANRSPGLTNLFK